MQLPIVVCNTALLEIIGNYWLRSMENVRGGVQRLDHLKATLSGSESITSFIQSFTVLTF